MGEGRSGREGRRLGGGGLGARDHERGDNNGNTNKQASFITTPRPEHAAKRSDED